MARTIPKLRTGANCKLRLMGDSFGRRRAESDPFRMTARSVGLVHFREFERFVFTDGHPTVESCADAPSSFILSIDINMTPKSKTANGGGGASLVDAAPHPDVNPERERVFNAFRQWGYLEGDLDPLGFLRPRIAPELQIEGEYAREARAIYY